MFRALIALFLIVTSARLPAAQDAPAGVWLDVPFIKQTEEGCGSASIAMVLQYWAAHGETVPPERLDAETIQRKLYSRKAHGIYASDVGRYFKESGFQTFAVNGEWSDLQKHLTAGRPLIVGLRPQTRFGGSALHYVVVVGGDWEHKAVLVNDPARGKLLRIEQAEFDKEWRATNNWMLLAVPQSAK